MSPSKVITLLFLGAVGGLLIAPAKGSETRRKLSRLINDVSDSIQDIVELFRDKANELSDRVVERENDSIAEQVM